MFEKVDNAHWPKNQNKCCPFYSIVLAKVLFEHQIAQQYEYVGNVYNKPNPGDSEKRG